MLRKVLFWTHLVTGVTVGLVIFFMAATGTILAFEHQIVDWAEKSIRTVTPPSGAERLSLDEIVAAARKEKPQARISAVTFKSDPAASVTVGLGRDGALYVNPYTAEILGGDSKIHEFMHTVEDLHRYLGNKKIGKPITGASALLFSVLLITGLFIWVPSTWTKRSLKRITVFNARLKGKARDWNWHNVIGFWTSPLILITTTTGVIMSYAWATNLLYRVTGNEPPLSAPQQQRGKPSDIVIPTASLDFLGQAAAQKVARWDSISLRLPQKPEAPVNANILEEDPTYGIPIRSQLSMDPLTAETKKWEPFSEANKGRVLRVWARYLHTGDVGGLPGQTLAFLNACGVMVMVWTGLAMAWRRYRNWKNGSSGQNPPKQTRRSLAEASSRRSS